MTSVSGHLLAIEFGMQFRNWQRVDPLRLFDAPINKYCPENFMDIKRTLEREVRGAHGLIIWTDCDREGENIGFEIIDVCRAIKPNIPVFRAKFSEITATAVRRALANLIAPDELQSQAVDVRSELDLRIGAAFTRFQTMRYQRLFPDVIEKQLVSYGSCQIPTLGFVVKRFKEVEAFQPQSFWKLRLAHTVDQLTVEWSWARNRLYDQQCCSAIFELCRAEQPPLVTVTNVSNKSKSKWRPVAMDTIELEKLGSRKLKLSAKETMTIAEKLYTQGFISYPRTETNAFSKEIDLRPLVEQQTGHGEWGQFACKVLEWGMNPRNGTKSDQAHPPIHPTKLSTALTGNEQRVYELIVRHFLACVSRDAVGAETIVSGVLADEEFAATGLCIHERNYLEVYTYERWSAKEIHAYEVGQTFEPTDLSMRDGKTTAPDLLTEAELIAMMDKHGIGTDATHAEHINTIMVREYIGKIGAGFLVPTRLGMGLVDGYESINLPLAQPELRAGLERDLKLVCSSQRQAADVLAEQIVVYRNAFRRITENASRMDVQMAEQLQTRAVDAPEPPPPDELIAVCKCPKCAGEMTLKTLNGTVCLSCLSYPDCRHSIWFPKDLRDAKVPPTDDRDDVRRCPRCKSRLVQFTFRSVRQTVGLDQRRMQDDGLTYETCIICDTTFQEKCFLDPQAFSADRGAPNRANSSGDRMQVNVTRPQTTAPPAAANRRMPPPPAPAPRPRPTATVNAVRPNINARAPPQPQQQWVNPNTSRTSIGSTNSGTAANRSTGNLPEVKCTKCQKVARL